MAVPLRSMTGFGASAKDNGGRQVRVEVRSVNQRNLRLSLRAQPALGQFESEARAMVSGAAQRGQIDVNLTLVRPAAETLSPQARAAAASAVSTLRQLGEELHLSGELTLGDLARLPGIFSDAGGEFVSQEEWKLLESALREALERFGEAREVEGAALAGALRVHADAIEAFAGFARKRAPEVVERQRARLLQRVEELRAGPLSGLDMQAVEREAVFFADRADITEEVDRLLSHAARFREVLADGREAGKRLEFLGQEMLREVNTIASKGNDTEIARQAVEAKLAAERIKEQAANVE